MSRAIPLAIFLLALIAVSPVILGAPGVPQVFNGFGSASTFQVFASGHALEGGLYGWNDLCANCEIRVTLGAGNFFVTGTDQFVGQLPPGVYELREYRGLFLFTQNARRDFSVEFHGIGKVDRLD